MRWTSLSLLALLAFLSTGVIIGSLLARTGQGRGVPIYEMIEPAGLQPTPAELDAADLQFNQFDVRTDISYGPHGRRNMLDLYIPQHAAEPLPVIVFIHGGGTNKSHKNEGTPFDWSIPLLSRGFAVAQINYRVFYKPPQFPDPYNDKPVPFPAQIEDCKSAIRFLKSNAASYGLDPTRIGVIGHSFGGYLAALVGTTGDTKEFDASPSISNVSGSAHAVCVISGSSQLQVNTPQVELHRKASGYLLPPNDTLSATQRFYIQPMDPHEVVQASPLSYVSPDDPPFLILHGFDDIVIPPHQANLLYVHLRNAGVPVELYLIPGASHGGPPLFNRQNRSRVVDFFNTHLGG
ncbi:MAG: alpha/beta hydrolase [Verrucomicrobiota bacterium]|jgi:acetyl esterase/lipase|nr:alpha/beta hydrolase [Verrucomicrobiota bacterium]MDD8051065.1 alpha/beta hydrolase [Verrucomicrobiota bacterium]MDI9382794.1 alpha/beta hydrolase [Verrucomicrobiota bacterium]